MKVKVYFDNAEERYKIYNGDTVINATEVTINEVAIDEQLSDTSANAVENRAVKKALDDNKSYSQEIVGSLNEKVDANKSDTDNKVGTLNSRIDEVINNGSTAIIKSNDLSWTWHDVPLGVAGESNTFKLPANTVIFIAFPRECTAFVMLNGSSIINFGTTTTDCPQLGTFITSDTITENDDFSLYVLIDGETPGQSGIKNLVESYTMILKANDPEELKDIRVDYFGFNHATAGDSVRSILNTIQNGKLNIDSFLSWTQISSATYTGSAQTEAKLLTNTDINITLPQETVIGFKQMGAPVVVVGDITATEEQHLVFTTDSDTRNYDIYLSSNSLEYNDLINAVELSMDFNIFFRKDTEMSDSSENVVQNKVIKEYIDKIIEPFIVTDTAKGTEIALNDSVDRPIKTISIMGKSTQNGTPTIDSPIPIVDITTEEIEITNGTDTQSAELSRTLRGIPVASGGNYTDNNNQQWICDTIERYKDGSGKYIQRVARITLDGRVTWTDYTSPIVWTNVKNLISGSAISVIDSVAQAETSLFTLTNDVKGYATVIDANDNSYMLKANRLYFSPTVNGQRLNATQFKEYLSSNSAEFECCLETPIETPLTSEELAELNLDTYYPSTTITANTDVVVEYVCTTQGYIDKRLNN